jgi:hypothetical protein
MYSAIPRALFCAKLPQTQQSDNTVKQPFPFLPFAFIVFSIAILLCSGIGYDGFLGAALVWSPPVLPHQELSALRSHL